MPIRILKPSRGHKRGRSFRNTRRENRLEELGRVDAEKAYTSRGKRNLREEKDRIRSELAVGGNVAKRAGRKIREMAQPDPSRPKTRGSRFSSKEAMRSGGGPDAGNIGKLKDALSKAKGLGKKVPKPDLSKLKKRMPKYMKPLGKRVKKRNGGSAAEHYLQHGYGPHKSSGKVLKGKKIGIQIK
jgi:hypothetical protein